MWGVFDIVGAKVSKRLVVGVGPKERMSFWYQSSSVRMKIVKVLGLVCVAMKTLCRASTRVFGGWVRVLVGAKVHKHCWMCMHC